MTTKNIKIALFAALIVALILPFSVMGMADAAANQNVDKKTTLTLEQQHELQRVTEIMNQRHELVSEKRTTDKSTQRSLDIDNRIAEIDREFDMLQKKSTDRYNVTPERQSELAKIRENTDFSGIPIVGMGTNGINKQLSFEILDTPENRADENKIRIQLQKLLPIGESFTLEFRDAPTTFACSSRQNCDPLYGGAQIEADSSGNCTFGYEATRLGAPGFVMAGHCANGDVGKSVYHPTGNQNPFGIVVSELYYSGTSCDCAFVGASTSDIDNKIYYAPNSYYQPTSYTSASSQSGQFVVMSGVDSDIEYGVVTDTDFTAWYGGWPFGIEVKHLVKSTINGFYGDSGAPVTKSNGSSLYGLVSGGQVFWGETYHSPVDRAITHLSATPVV